MSNPQRRGFEAVRLFDRNWSRSHSRNRRCQSRCFVMDATMKRSICLHTGWSCCMSWKVHNMASRKNTRLGRVM